MTGIVKHKLSESEEESTLIAIVSSSPGYSLCWHMNKLLQWNLYRTKDCAIEIIEKKNQKLKVQNLFSEENDFVNQGKEYSIHQAFKYSDEAQFIDYYFMSNKGSKTYLEPIHKKVSFFLEIFGNHTESPEELIFKLNTLDIVDLAFIIPQESIINKHKLYL